MSSTFAKEGRSVRVDRASPLLKRAPAPPSFPRKMLAAYERLLCYTSAVTRNESTDAINSVLDTISGATGSIVAQVRGQEGGREREERRKIERWEKIRRYCRPLMPPDSDSYALPALISRSFLILLFPERTPCSSDVRQDAGLHRGKRAPSFHHHDTTSESLPRPRGLEGEAKGVEVEREQRKGRTEGRKIFPQQGLRATMSAPPP